MIEFLYEGRSYKLDPNDVRTGLDAIQLIRTAKPDFPYRKLVGLRSEGNILDLHMQLPKGGSLEFINIETPEGTDIVRHSCAHILAQAVKALFPDVQVTIGPVIENGFFYDFSRKGGFKEDELGAIEKKMSEIINAKLPIRREEWATEKAIEFFKNIGEHYKCEIIRDLGQPSVSVYWQGDFVDLCRGPHIPDTSKIPAFKLMSVAGAYWRGSEKNEMLGRIYGTAWSSEKDQKAYLNMLEEAKKRDHRKVGTELDLFSFHPEAPAAPFFHPNGAFIYASITDFLRHLNRANGFMDVVTPLVLSEELWKTSGHYDNYRENMYFTEIDERGFAVKPMNCPGHCLIYGTHKHSYRELPMRLAEFGRVHRHERSGVTAGLFRVRSFVQDDAHVYCTQEQVENEIIRVLGMIKTVYSAFDFTYKVELSTRPEKRIGSDDVWDKAEKALENALNHAGEKFTVNPGDGAFYGPKIDFHLKDSIGRTHQCGTIQLDYSMPSRFGLEYAGADNKHHTPVMIHRAIVGSLERFIGIYIEHVAGRFPLWLAPTQATIMTIVDEAKPFAEELLAQMRQKGYRVTLDDSSDKLNAKVKKAQLLKIPNMVVIGAREAQEKQVSLRLLTGEQKRGLTVDAFLTELAIQTRPPYTPLS